MMGLTTIIGIQSLLNSLLYSQDSAEVVRRPQAEAPFQHCSDHIIVNLVGIVLCVYKVLLQLIVYISSVYNVLL